MSTYTTPVEGLDYGMLPSGKGFPDEFSLSDEIHNYRFYLMCKLKFPNQEVFTKSHDVYLENLKNTLFNSSHSLSLVKKIINKITLSAYYTISETFYENVKKREKT